MAMVLPLFSGSASGTGEPFEVHPGRTVAFGAYASGGSINAPSIEGSFDGSHWFSVIGALGGYAETGDLLRFVRAVYDDLGHTGTATVLALQSDED
jgi:hypothetical protein